MRLAAHQAPPYLIKHVSQALSMSMYRSRLERGATQGDEALMLWHTVTCVLDDSLIDADLLAACGVPKVCYCLRADVCILQVFDAQLVEPLADGHRVVQWTSSS